MQYKYIETVYATHESVTEVHTRSYSGKLLRKFSVVCMHRARCCYFYWLSAMYLCRCVLLQSSILWFRPFVHFYFNSMKWMFSCVPRVFYLPFESSRVGRANEMRWWFDDFIESLCMPWIFVKFDRIVLWFKNSESIWPLDDAQ